MCLCVKQTEVWETWWIIALVELVEVLLSENTSCLFILILLFFHTLLFLSLPPFAVPRSTPPVLSLHLPLKDSSASFNSKCETQWMTGRDGISPTLHHHHHDFCNVTTLCQMEPVQSSTPTLYQLQVIHLLLMTYRYSSRTLHFPKNKRLINKRYRCTMMVSGGNIVVLYLKFTFAWIFCVPHL